MADEITAREWSLLVEKQNETTSAVKEVQASVATIDKHLAKLLERGAYNDERVAAAERKAEEALGQAWRAHSRLDVHESRLGGNTRALDTWQGLAIKICGALAVAAIIFAAGRFAG